MSSLRLALKQSLEESGLSTSQPSKHSRKKSSVPRRYKRRPGDPPRKRGRPRKHPRPEDLAAQARPQKQRQQQQQQQKESNDSIVQQQEQDEQKTQEQTHQSHGESSSSDENEFSSSHEDSSRGLDDDEAEEEERDEHDDSKQPPTSNKQNFTASQVTSHKANQSSSAREETNSNTPSNNSSPSEATTRASEHEDDIVLPPKKKKKPKPIKKEQAANKIQSQWKKKHNETSSARAASPKPIQQQQQTPSPAPSETTKPKNANRQQYVAGPSDEILAWVSKMSVKQQKRNMCAGLRVKVQFSQKATKRDGRVVRRLRWYGGLVTAVSTGGSKIRIKYDDGTSEICKFPDKDIVVDCTKNGRHQVSAAAFLPPDSDTEDEEEVLNSLPEESDEKIKPQSDDEAEQNNEISNRKNTPLTSDSMLLVSKDSELPKRTRDVEMTETSNDMDSDNMVNNSDDAASPNGMARSKTKRSNSESDLDGDRKQTIEGEPIKKPLETAQDKQPKAPKKSKSGDIIDKDRHVVGDETTITKNDAVAESSESFCMKTKIKTGNADVKKTSETSSKLEIVQNKKSEKAVVVEAKEKNKIKHSSPEQPTVSHEEKKSSEAPPLKSHKETPTQPPKQSQKEKIQGRSSATGKVISAEDYPREKSSKKSLKESFKKISKKRSRDALDDEIPRTTKNSPTQEETEESKMNPRPNEHALEPVEKKLKKKHESKIKVQNDSFVESKKASSVNLDHDNSPEKIESTQKRKKEEKREDKPTLSKNMNSADNASKIADSPIQPKASTFEKPVPVKNKRSTTPVPTHSNGANVEHTEASDNKGTDILSRSGVFEKKEKKEKKDRSRNSSPSDDTEKTPRSMTPVQDRADSSNLQRSGRRAAQQANERIASRQELVIQDFNKPKKRRDKEGKEKSTTRERKRKEPEGDGKPGDNEDEEVWAKCDRCGKWRVLPSSVDVATLPKHWYCEMNDFDELRNSCDAPEQTAEEVAKSRRKAKRRRAKLARLEAEREAAAAAATTTSTEEGEMTLPSQKDQRREKNDKKRRSPMPERRESDGKKEKEKPLEGKGKRVVSTGVEEQHGSDSGLEQKTDGKRKRPRQTDDDENDEYAQSGRGKRGKRRSSKEAKEEKGKSGKGSGKDKDSDNQQEWVQCEKCEKWRRLPNHISANDLPEVWYCTMNSWDASTASCDAAEDKAESGTRDCTISGGMAVAQGGHKPSYRSLIFGSGKKHNRPISERMRAAESLFSTGSFEDYPTVMYASSSVFVPKSHTKMEEKEKETDAMTFLELMSHSKLWADLQGVGKRLNSLTPDLPSSCTLDKVEGAGKGLHVPFVSLSDSRKQQMKSEILRVLEKDALGGNEILTRLQFASTRPMTECLSLECILGSLLELQNEGKVEGAPADESTCGNPSPKFRLVTANGGIPSLSEERLERVSNRPVRSRCMKIAKPWKRTNLFV